MAAGEKLCRTMKDYIEVRGGKNLGEGLMGVDESFGFNNAPRCNMVQYGYVPVLVVYLKM